MNHTQKAILTSLLMFSAFLKAETFNEQVDILKSSNTDYALTVTNGGGSATAVKIRGGNSGSDAKLLNIMSWDETRPFFIVTDDRVGIGLDNPGSVFTVVRRGYSGESDHSSLAYIHQSTNPDGLLLQPALELENGGGNGYGLVSQARNNYFSGRVGIGTTTPSHQLSVNGTVQAKEVIVETDWSDFVFEDSYYLRSLDEVEKHIKVHGHLPDVPSASAVESEGLSVGEAQKIMMQKIEELTLYMIEQDKRNSVLEAEVRAQREEIERLKTN